ncbi:hypothetical protein SCHPADRAFT_942348 [Schizopora paradoxa]|uniref:N-acetyltransferase domain-containing protein n=1 Tax=Schizopora paradoxa TaxID=27342 RepID=A0A0H2RHN2_9AGAM|nr:hypothetical protein SCHPADRAFT_942348 [Schizopora paradoxa]
MSIYLGGHRELTLEFVSSVVKAGVIGGEVYVAEDTSGVIVGASVWFTPGQDFLDSEEQRSAGYDKIMAKLAETSPKMSAWWTEYFNRHAAETFKNAFGDSHYGVNCWHLYLVGVQPSLQRRGIATALMDDAEARIRAHPESNEHARTIILGTSTDGKFYEKRGFTKKGEFDVKSIEELNEPLTTRYYSKIVE